MSVTTIEHVGRVDEVTRNDIRVTITSKSACAGCHARNVCTAAETKDKVIVISKPIENFIVGEEVKVIMRQSLGFKALFYGYVLPVIILVVALVIFSLLGVSEIKSAIFAILLLVPYYLLLRLFRKKLEKQFAFSIEKLG